MMKPSGTGRSSRRIRMSPLPFPPQRARTSSDPRSSENLYTNLPAVGVSAALSSAPRSASGTFMLSSCLPLRSSSRATDRRGTPPAPPTIPRLPRPERWPLQLGDDLLCPRDGGGAHRELGDAEFDELRDHGRLPGRLPAHPDPDPRLP